MVNHALTAQLAYLRDRVETPVKDFALQFDLAHFGRQILEGLTENGLVQRSWKRSRGFYALTEEGRVRLQELEAAISPLSVSETADAKPNSRQQPDLQGQRPGRAGDRPGATASGNNAAAGSTGARSAAN